ncbi:MAG: hypothetical protein ACOCZ9_00995 [Spirochaetota bacterium]
MKIFRTLQFRFRGVEVYALVGKSGTGKSFRARLVAEKHGIDLMIDDGLVIRGRKILAGRSAKRENNYLTAVKTALFTDKEHRRQVLKAIEREHFRRILILGTSEKMIDRIVKTLNLPPPVKTIAIEEVATAEEIASAIHMRRTQGRHVIPVPSIEVKRNHSGFMTESLKVFLRKGVGFFRRQKVYEKSVVRPEFSHKGSVSISEAALGQMILHCVEEYGINADVRKVRVRSEPSGYRLKLTLDIPFGEEMASPIHELQSYIVESIERYTGVIIEEMNIVIESVSERQRRKLREKQREKEATTAEKDRARKPATRGKRKSENTPAVLTAKADGASVAEDRSTEEPPSDAPGRKSKKKATLTRDEHMRRDDTSYITQPGSADRGSARETTGAGASQKRRGNLPVSD